MRLTKKKIAFSVLELLFSGIIPLALIISQYSNIGHTAEAVGFKLSITGIMLVIIVFMAVKKTFLNRRLEDLHSQTNNNIADLKTENNPDRARLLEGSIKAARTAETVIGAIPTSLLFVAVIVCCKALEAQLIKLTGVVGLILISYIVGTIFAVLSAREVVGKHKEKK